MVSKLLCAHRLVPAPLALAGLLALVALVGCRSLPLIPGTRVIDTRENRQLIDVCEEYRQALEERDAAKLLALAHPRYFEDSGTRKGDDDYGYEGLKTVIETRIPALRAVRYNIEYRRIQRIGDVVYVDIRYDASFQIATPRGDRWERKQNDKRLVLKNEGGRWKFLAGM